MEASQPGNAMEKFTLSTHSVQISLVNSVQLTPHCSAMVAAKLELSMAHCYWNQLVILQNKATGLEMGESFCEWYCSNNGFVKVLLTYSTGLTQKVEKETYVGVASEAKLATNNEHDALTEVDMKSITAEAPMVPTIDVTR